MLVAVLVAACVVNDILPWTVASTPSRRRPAGGDVLVWDDRQQLWYSYVAERTREFTSRRGTSMHGWAGGAAQSQSASRGVGVERLKPPIHVENDGWQCEASAMEPRVSIGIRRRELLAPLFICPRVVQAKMQECRD